MADVVKFSNKNLAMVGPFEVFALGYNLSNIDPVSLPDNIYLQYMGGIFKKIGKIGKQYCSIKTDKKELIKKIASVIDIPYEEYNSGDMYTLFYTNNNAIDFIDKLYPGKTYYSHFTSNALLNSGEYVPICKMVKTREDAVEPFKSRLSDVGYDLTIIDIKKQISKKCTLYTTGIIVEIECGWYTEIVPRSSLIKTGYMLANSIGIIESTYKGELMIALIKIDDDAPDIELPYRGFQLIVRKQHHTRIQEVSMEKIESSQRGTGGFGSTNQ